MRQKALFTALAACFSSVAWANPTGPVVTVGNAAISQSGKTLQITNTPGAVIQWQGFSIAADETTRFVQSSAASTVLNRVVGNMPSSLLGQLQSNGRVYLLNPNGVFIGAGAIIDVAGFAASTLRFTDADFLAGTELHALDVMGEGGHHGGAQGAVEEGSAIEGRGCGHAAPHGPKKASGGRGVTSWTLTTRVRMSGS